MFSYSRTAWIPGFRKEIVAIAPTRVPVGRNADDTVACKEQAVAPDARAGYFPRVKARLVDRWLDAVVAWSGSWIVFSTILSGLVVWAFLGIRYHDNLQWQALISDIQAILSYVFDSFLVRQQTNAYEDLMNGAAQLRSRGITHERTLRKLVGRVKEEDLDRLVSLKDQVDPAMTGFTLDLPEESWLNRIASVVSKVLGHLVTIVIYWTCIIVWLGFGPANGWSNTWQLNINSATSALMVFVFAFIANIRERHANYIRHCLDAVFQVDAALEDILRSLTDDQQANIAVVIPAQKVNVVQTVIFYYADVVGTLVGIIMLAIVLMVWLAIGPVMQFNDNWWLFIGTYAGLVGMNDGFVLRNTQSKLSQFEDDQFCHMDQQDAKLLSLVRQANGDRVSPATHKVDITRRISFATAKVCAHEITVVAGFIILLGLITGASVMKWSTTGQLICDVPPSIIESFFMLILITGHNYVDEERRNELRNVYLRRLELLGFAALSDKASILQVELRRPDRHAMHPLTPTQSGQVQVACPRGHPHQRPEDARDLCGITSRQRTVPPGEDRPRDCYRRQAHQPAAPTRPACSAGMRAAELAAPAAFSQVR
jgi:low-affinity ferrous iron transport protein